ncbi:DUF4380 domain-containing protein [candidate division KSB1 bacterium]|nr:DUF4380 domain-containing protein [candidate division KSB1 bacterium]
MKRVTYQGWEDAIEIQNNSIRIVIVPQIGRIMHFGPVDGPNLIWINPELEGKILTDFSPELESPDSEWANFGGDKVWPVEQFRWPDVNERAWPPDPWFDGSPHEVEILSDGITLFGPVSPFCGARCIRTIKIEEAGSRVMIEQRIEKVQSGRQLKLEPIPMTIWSVTQVIQPDEILFPLNPESSLPDQIFIYDDNPVTKSNLSRKNGLCAFKPSRTDHQKIGTDGDGWLAAICGDHAFVQQLKRLPDAIYPEGGLSVEVYTAPESYIELEILSPLHNLEVEERIESTITWELISLNSKAIEEKREELQRKLS